MMTAATNVLDTMYKEQMGYLTKKPVCFLRTRSYSRTC